MAEAAIIDLKSKNAETLFFDIKTALKQGSGEQSYKVITGCYIDFQKFLKFLHDLGFRRMDIDRYNSIFIQIKDGKIIKEVDKKHISDVCIDFIKVYFEDFTQEIGGQIIDLNYFLNVIFGRLNRLFDVTLLYRLKSDKSIEFNRDGKNEKFVYFKNGYVHLKKVYSVDGSGAERINIKQDFLQYTELPGYIWEDEILQRDFAAEENYQSGIFYKFINLVCGSQTTEIKDYVSRRISLMSIIGYCTHNFYDRKLKLIEFTDSRLSEEDEANGRSGKSLLSKAIGYFINADKKSAVYCEINGKTFDVNNPRRFQEAGPETKLININDARRDLTLEDLYADITEGVTVERKNQHPFKINAKILITKNKPLRTMGSSDKDRVCEFEFSSFFNEHTSPETHFGLWLFRDFTKDEWLKFDLFMIECVKVFLLNDIVKSENISLNIKKIEDATNRDFIKWLQSPGGLIETIEHFVSKSGSHSIVKNELFAQFTTEFPDYQKTLKQNTFTRWIKFYFDNTGNVSVLDEKSRKDEKIEWVYTFTKKRKNAK